MQGARYAKRVGRVTTPSDAWPGLSREPRPARVTAQVRDDFRFGFGRCGSIWVTQARRSNQPLMFGLVPTTTKAAGLLWPDSKLTQVPAHDVMPLVMANLYGLKRRLQRRSLPGTVPRLRLPPGRPQAQCLQKLSKVAPLAAFYANELGCRASSSAKFTCKRCALGKGRPSWF